MVGWLAWSPQWGRGMREGVLVWGWMVISHGRTRHRLLGPHPDGKRYEGGVLGGGGFSHPWAILPNLALVGF
jgi:hypothetical protein